METVEFVTTKRLLTERENLLARLHRYTKMIAWGHQLDDLPNAVNQRLAQIETELKNRGVRMLE